MEIKKFLEIQTLAEYVADQVLNQLKIKPVSIFYLASGSTQIPVYAQLVSKFQDSDLTFSESFICALDEYLGFSPNRPPAFHSYMRQHLLDQIDIPQDHLLYPNGSAANPKKEAEQYRQKLAELGPADFALLGLGINGHIAFNEPDSAENSSTRVVQLTEETRQANQGDFSSLNQVPKKAITVGIGEILAAERILLVATGKHKKPILKKLLTINLSPEIPASFLNIHPNCQLVTDQEI